jgi:hypothetical protein
VPTIIRKTDTEASAPASPVRRRKTVIQGVLSLRRIVAVLFLASLPLLLGGCDFLTGVSEPEQLRVVIESDDVSSVTLVMSPYFLQITDPECPECEAIIQLVQSDTTVQTLPFDQTFAFTSRQQYFVETFPEIEPVATLSLKVFIDGDVWYDDFRELKVVGQDGERETLRFVYQFRELLIPR